MKALLIKAALGIAARLIEHYATKENFEIVERLGKKLAYQKIKALAAATDFTDLDDILAEKIGDYWKVKDI